jgi:hypothetical protein
MKAPCTKFSECSGLPTPPDVYRRPCSPGVDHAPPITSSWSSRAQQPDSRRGQLGRESATHDSGRVRPIHNTETRHGRRVSRLTCLRTLSHPATPKHGPLRRRSRPAEQPGDRVTVEISLHTSTACATIHTWFSGSALWQMICSVSAIRPNSQWRIASNPEWRTLENIERDTAPPPGTTAAALSPKTYRHCSAWLGPRVHG